MSSSFRDFVKSNKQETIISTKQKPINKEIIQKNEPKEKPMENEAFTEAQSYIKNLKKKIDTVFYRFGMSGLERIDEAIIGTLNEMLNADKKKTIKESRRLPGRIAARTAVKTSKETTEENLEVQVPEQPVKKAKRGKQINDVAIENSANTLLNMLSQQAASMPAPVTDEQVIGAANTKNAGSGMTMESIEALSMALGGTKTDEEK